ncbi:acyl carrier protein [Parageobacillus thermoglucosidasius]|uniref:Acyl carrier protein n=1 Tax=Parageobacillus thermoglucosidasius TaxID=1426 RepID=A0AB38R2I1_PARTM|nr:phosphopantetheine-binding protein [Parageobacillus thermoglucosidasius]UOE77550.1 acyl carrier protein [Parageobacillus thermoglucosidasius]
MEIRNEIISRIKIALGEVIETLNTEELQENTDLFNDLNLDSTSVIELLMALEDHFETVEFDPENLKIEDFQTIGSLANFIQNQIKELSY